MVAVRVGNGVDVLVGIGVFVCVAVGGTGVRVLVAVGFGVNVFVGRGVLVGALVAVGDTALGTPVSVGTRISAGSTAVVVVTPVPAASSSSELLSPDLSSPASLLPRRATFSAPSCDCLSSDPGSTVNVFVTALEAVFVNVLVTASVSVSVSVCVEDAAGEVSSVPPVAELSAAVSVGNVVGAAVGGAVVDGSVVGGSVDVAVGSPPSAAKPTAAAVGKTSPAASLCRPIF